MINLDKSYCVAAAFSIRNAGRLRQIRQTDLDPAGDHGHEHGHQSAGTQHADDTGIRIHGLLSGPDRRSGTFRLHRNLEIRGDIIERTEDAGGKALECESRA
jgi:hypothetical protein